MFCSTSGGLEHPHIYVPHDVYRRGSLSLLLQASITAMRRGRLSDNVISQYGYGSILVLGDSIAQLSFSPGGFSSELAAKVSNADPSYLQMSADRVLQYAGRLDVLNRGMAGYTSEQLLHMLEDHPQFPESSDVRLILLVIGTNDW